MLGGELEQGHVGTTGDPTLLGLIVRERDDPKRPARRKLQSGRKGELGAANGDERRKLVKRYLTAHDGPLACERMVDVLESMTKARPGLPKPALNRRVLGCTLANWRRFNRYVRKNLPGKHAPEEFHRHRYPGISLKALNKRISRLLEVIGDGPKLSTDQISDQIFVVGPLRSNN